MLRIKLIKNKSFKEFLMPSYIEYWRTLSYSTCQQYKSYKNIVRFRKNLFRHATKNGVTLINCLGDNDYENFMANIIKPGARRAAEDNGVAFRAKRIRLPKIEIAQAPMDTFVDNTLEQLAERPMEQEQQPEQTQEAEPEQIEENDVAPVPIDIAPPCGRNTNGAHKPLILNGIAIEVDPVTLMVNATQMCQAAGKRWIKYYDNDKTKSYIQYIETKVRIRTLDLIKSNRGGDHSGTMVHRLIAYDLASWLSQDVKLQFYMWNDELLLTGRVELGNEMNAQQLDEVFQQRVYEVEAKASVRCQALELQLATIQEAQQLTKAAQEELMAIKAREDLETTIQALVNNTAPTIASFKNGDNVLYLARIDETKFKYGCSKNVERRFDAHKRPGVYPTFEPIKILPCANAVASEDKVRAYVKKNKLGAEYGTQREVVVLESVDALQRMMKKMYKFCLQQHVTTQPANEGADVVLRRIDADASIKMKKIEADVDIKKLEADVDIKKIEADMDMKKLEAGMENTKIETMLMQMLINKIITVEHYLQIKNFK